MEEVRPHVPNLVGAMNSQSRPGHNQNLLGHSQNLLSHNQHRHVRTLHDQSHLLGRSEVHLVFHNLPTLVMDLQIHLV